MKTLITHCQSKTVYFIEGGKYAVQAQTPKYCIFQSYAKTVPLRMKLTMKLTMREPASMTTDT